MDGGCQNDERSKGARRHWGMTRDRYREMAQIAYINKSGKAWRQIEA
jgi:hypothetical protein